MGILRDGLRGVLRVIGETVARNHLFEQPGEREPTPPLPPPSESHPAAEAREPQESGSQTAEPQPPVEPEPEPARDLEPSSPGPLVTRLADEYDLGQLQDPGLRPRVLHHWATWCAPCDEELPHIEELAQRLGEQADLVGISWELFSFHGGEQEALQQVQRVEQERSLSWPSLIFNGPPEALFDVMGLSCETVPQTAVLDRDGQVLVRFDGPLSAENLQQILDLLEPSP